MVRIAIIDDDKSWISKAEKCIKDFYRDKEIEVAAYESGKSFLEADVEYDIAFMDIEMPEKDGFETTTEYRAKYAETIIIILTTHTEMSRKGYLINAFRYIDKVKMESEIEEALRAIEYTFLQRATIKVRLIGVGTVEVTLRDLVYIETCKRNLILHTRTNEYLCNCTMEQMEEELKKKGFFRCHKSYIVNLDCIKKIEKGRLYLYNGEEIIISRRKIGELKEAYVNRKLETVNR